MLDLKCTKTSTFDIFNRFSNQFPNHIIVLYFHFDLTPHDIIHIQHIFHVPMTTNELQ